MDQTFNLNYLYHSASYMVGVVQLANTSDCGSEERGFESRLSPHINYIGRTMRTDILGRKDDIQRWVNEHRSKGFICEQLKCRRVTLERYLQILNLQYAGNQGSSGRPSNNYKSAMEYLNSTTVKSHTLKIKLIRDGVKQNCCEMCGNTTWMGVALPLELHHKDGDHFNNTIDNLAILCPNCHAIQKGNSGANVGSYTTTNAGMAELEDA